MEGNLLFILFDCGITASSMCIERVCNGVRERIINDLVNHHIKNRTISLLETHKEKYSECTHLLINDSDFTEEVIAYFTLNYPSMKIINLDTDIQWQNYTAG